MALLSLSEPEEPRLRNRFVHRASHKPSPTSLARPGHIHGFRRRVVSALDDDSCCTCTSAASPSRSSLSRNQHQRNSHDCFPFHFNVIVRGDVPRNGKWPSDGYSFFSCRHSRAISAPHFVGIVNRVRFPYSTSSLLCDLRDLRRPRDVLGMSMAVAFAR
eukprot:2597685-Pleurochrysis_carterae.AAC.1